MLLEGSCYCGAAKFSVESYTPYHPYMRCYCSICRKTAGGGGYTIKVKGRKSISVYRALVDDEDHPRKKVQSPARPHFCPILICWLLLARCVSIGTLEYM